MVYTGSLLLLLSPLTPLHAGTGRSGGIVDLPVQRDNLGFPIIYASSLKGAIKTHVLLREREFKNKNESIAEKLFGPEPEKTKGKYIAPVSFTDAFPILVPARSAKGNPVMITSGFMARRGIDLIELALSTEDKSEEELKDIADALYEIISISEELEDGKVMVFSKKPVIECCGKVIIAGEPMEAKPPNNGVKSNGWNIIKSVMPKAFEEVIPDKIVVLNDDDALRIIEKSMIRLARVRLDKERKVVDEKKGGLWIEEYLPHGTLLISVILYSKYRASSIFKDNSDSDLRSKIIDAIGIRNKCGYLVFGGKESIGKGLTKACIL